MLYMYNIACICTCTCICTLHLNCFTCRNVNSLQTNDLLKYRIKWWGSSTAVTINQCHSKFVYTVHVHIHGLMLCKKFWPISIKIGKFCLK